MRKMKKINGYLVVRFNDREKREYSELGSYGVIDAEMYSGNLALDLGEMEYSDAGTLEEAAEQARSLESEFDMEEPKVQVTIVKDVDGVTSEERYNPVQMFTVTRTLLASDIQRGMGEDIDARTAAHELRGFVRALMTMGVVPGGDERFYVALDSFGPPEAEVPPVSREDRLAYICDELCRHRAADISREELDGFCERCAVGRRNEAPPRDHFVHLPGKSGNSYFSHKLYSLGAELEKDCPDNDCSIYAAVFRVARELDEALDSLSGSTAEVVQQGLWKRFRSLTRMYHDNYAVKEYLRRQGACAAQRETS